VEVHPAARKSGHSMPTGSSCRPAIAVRKSVHSAPAIAHDVLQGRGREPHRHYEKEEHNVTRLGGRLSWRPLSLQTLAITANGCGAGIGRMLDTFQPSAVFTTTWFFRKRVG